MQYGLSLCINRAREYSINNNSNDVYQSPTAKMSNSRNRQQTSAATDTSTIDAYPLDSSSSNAAHSRRRSNANNNNNNGTSSSSSKAHKSQHSSSGTSSSRRNSDHVNNYSATAADNNNDTYNNEYGYSNDANTGNNYGRKQQQQQQQQGSSAMFVKAVRPCSYCHVPYNNRLAPFANMRLVPCGVCGRKWVAQTVSS
jgi:hypothetical protein